MVVSFFPKDCCHVLPAVHGGMSLQKTLCFGREDPLPNKPLMSLSLTLGFLPSGGWTTTRLVGCGVQPKTYSLMPFLKILFVSGVDFFVCSILFSPLVWKLHLHRKNTLQHFLQWVLLMKSPSFVWHIPPSFLKHIFAGYTLKGWHW